MILTWKPCGTSPSTRRAFEREGGLGSAGVAATSAPTKGPLPSGLGIRVPLLGWALFLQRRRRGPDSLGLRVGFAEAGGRCHCGSDEEVPDTGALTSDSGRTGRGYCGSDEEVFCSLRFLFGFPAAVRRAGLPSSDSSPGHAEGPGPPWGSGCAGLDLRSPQQSPAEGRLRTEARVFARTIGFATGGSLPWALSSAASIPGISRFACRFHALLREPVGIVGQLGFVSGGPLGCVMPVGQVPVGFHSASVQSIACA